jgi:hypothetical protein
MKKLLLSLLALPAATFALEASAQSGYGAQANVGMNNRIANLEARVDAGIQVGVIDRNEARTLRRQLNELRRLEMSYSQNGLTSSERRTLQQRIRSVRDQVRMAGGTGWARNYGWNDDDMYGNSGYGNSGVTYDQYGRPMQTQRYDQYGRPVDQYGRVMQTQRVDQYGRPVDQYGRPITNGYYGQGGPYEPVPYQRNNGMGNVVGGVLGGMMGGNSGGGILGSILSNGGLRIGDVITGVLGTALGGGSSLGYRDRSDVYFRTDGQRVYEIDARTNQVIRIHPAR